jgi:hypothetical protein
VTASTLALPPVVLADDPVLTVTFPLFWSDRHDPEDHRPGTWLTGAVLDVEGDLARVEVDGHVHLVPHDRLHPVTDAA